jgi:hypothetical protein
MSSMRFTAHLDTTTHGSPHLFGDAGVIADSLTGIHSVMVTCLFVVNRSCVHKVIRCPRNPEDSNLAGMEAMQFVLLYISTDYDRCY